MLENSSQKSRNLWEVSWFLLAFYIRISKHDFSVTKATLESEMSVSTSITKTPQPLIIAPIDHRAYQPLSLSTIDLIDHQAYRPSSLLNIEPIDHQAYWPSSLLNIEPIDHRAYRPSSLLTIVPINHWAYRPLVFFRDF